MHPKNHCAGGQVQTPGSNSLPEGFPLRSGHCPSQRGPSAATLLRGLFLPLPSLAPGH